jgi:hypothetical protein
VTFSPKQITTSFSLANGNFSPGGGNNYTASGLRTIARIENRGGASQSRLDLRIFGLPLSVMNQLTTLGTQINFQQKNGIMVSAGDANGSQSLVFQGNIYQAWVDGQNQPQVSLCVKATPGNFYNVKPQTPLSFKGPTQASTIAQKIAGYLGATLENNGVSTVLTNPYFASDAMSMIHKLAEHAGFDYILDRGVLAITPPGQARGGGTPLISPSTTLDGYPEFVSNTVVVKALFDPSVKYRGLVQIQSDITPACGTWLVSMLDLDLEASVPHGKWFMTITGITTQSIDTDQ